MTKTIKLDKVHNYFIDTKTGVILDSYDPYNPNIELVLNLEDSCLKVSSTNIKQQYGGDIIVQYNNDKHIIDDYHQNTLIKCGYIVYQNYDLERILDYKVGCKIKSIIMDDIIENTKDVLYDHNIDIDIHDNEFRINDKESNYLYTVRFSTVNDIVNKNHMRKDNNLSFYPFNKSMDKFGSIYLSIFAKNNAEEDSKAKYNLPNTFIRELINNLGDDYHYVSLPIKSKILYSEEL
jgi:hypothetical protein